MSDKPVVRGRLATRDIQAAAEHYRSAASAAQAQKFIDALEEAYFHINRFPAAGSPRYGHILDVPDLRSWPVSGFPYLVLYAEQEFSIDIYRVLHTARDIPTSLTYDIED